MTSHSSQSELSKVDQQADKPTRQLVIVVDDRRRFAVHVWRHLSLAMEFGFPERKLADSPNNASSFARTSTDGMLEVRWHDPNNQSCQDYETALRAESKEDPSLQLWTVIDVRGVRDVKDASNPERSSTSEETSAGGEAPEPTTHQKYYKAFLSCVRPEDSDRAWIVSAYGGGWGDQPRIRPKSVDTLDALRKCMGLNKKVSLRALESSDDVAILVTGAGFELKRRPAARNEHVADAQVDIGFPGTAALLEAMRPNGVETTWDRGESGSYPALRNVQKANSPAMRDLDRYWDELLEHVSGKKTAAGADLSDGEAADVEYAWREAFRRSLLAHDFGHQLQSIAAARLDFNYWLSTNYSRFADRAIDLVSDANRRSTPDEAQERQATSRAEAKPAPLLWRAITTTIEADAMSPDLYSERDIAAVHRVLLKLHGDIGHTWTMAVAGQDKLPRSKLYVRPELHRMYAVAQAMVLTTLWRRNAGTCTWHIVGHGLRDRALLHLIATVILRSPPSTIHQIIWVAPRTGGSKEPGGMPTSMFQQTSAERDAALAEIKQRFHDAGEKDLASRLCSLPTETAAQSYVDQIVSRGPFFARVCTDAIGYMNHLSTLGLAVASRLGEAQEADLRAPRVPPDAIEGGYPPEISEQAGLGPEGKPEH